MLAKRDRTRTPSKMSDELFTILEKVASNTHHLIRACNRPGQKNYDDMVLVFVAQQKCDAILGNKKNSLLQRIQQCAKVIRELQAGNCMMQSFVAFDDLLQHLIAAKLITLDKGMQISIKTTSKDHAFLLVDGIVCDPWANFCGSWEKYRSKRLGKGDLADFFTIRADWLCYSDGFLDQHSTFDTFRLFNCFQGPLFVFDSKKSESLFIPSVNHSSVITEGAPLSAAMGSSFVAEAVAAPGVKAPSLVAMDSCSVGIAPSAVEKDLCSVGIAPSPVAMDCSVEMAVTCLAKKPLSPRALNSFFVTMDFSSEEEVVEYKGRRGCYDRSY